VRFTRSKDRGTVYAFALARPGPVLHLRSVTAREGSEVHMLGHERPLEWSQDEDGLHIQVPAELEDMGSHAWTFRIRTDR
jgi:hypothetical protein